MNKKSISQLSKDYDSALKIGQSLVEGLNEIRVLLGMELLKLQAMHQEKIIKENYGSFRAHLATWKLNPRRVNDLIWNAEYIQKEGVPRKYWRYLDLGIVRYFRRKKKKLPDIHDIKE